MFSSTLLLYIRRNSLELYKQNTEGYLGRLEFPADTAKDEEVINQQKFEELILNFLNKFSLKENKAIIILSDDVLFQKTLPLSDETAEEKQAQDFFQTVPFDPEKIVQNAVKTKNGVSLFATNKFLFLACVNALAQIQKEVKAVVPATIFALTQTASALSKEDLGKISDNSDLAEAANFLKSLEDAPKVEAPKEQNQTQEIQKKAKGETNGPNFLLIIGVLIIIFGSITAAVMYKRPDLVKFNPKIPGLGKNIPSTSPLPSITSEATLLDNSAAVKKDELTTQVLNGTDKTGQATEVKKVLENLGFSKIETGNANNQNQVTTTVQFTERVGTETRQEVVNVLEKQFSDLRMDIALSQDFDIIITTGTAK